MFITEPRDYKNLVKSLKFMYKNRKLITEADVKDFQEHVFVYTGVLQSYEWINQDFKWRMVKKIISSEKNKDLAYIYGINSMLSMFLYILMYKYRDEWFEKKEIVTIACEGCYDKYFEMRGHIFSYASGRKEAGLYISKESIDNCYLCLHTLADEKFQLFYFGSDLNFYEEVQKGSLKSFKRGLLLRQKGGSKMNLYAISYFSHNGFYIYEGLYHLYMFVKEGFQSYKEGGSSYSSCSYGFGAVRKNYTAVLKGIETALSKSRPGSSLFLDIDLNKNLLGVLSYLLVRLPSECYTPTRFMVTDALYVDIGNSKHVVITPKEDADRVEILNATLGKDMIVRVYTKNSVKNFKVGNYAHGIHVVSVKDDDLRQMRRKLMLGGNDARFWFNL